MGPGRNTKLAERHDDPGGCLHGAGKNIWGGSRKGRFDVWRRAISTDVIAAVQRSRTRRSLQRDVLRYLVKPNADTWVHTQFIQCFSSCEGGRAALIGLGAENKKLDIQCGIVN